MTSDLSRRQWLQGGAAILAVAAFARAPTALAHRAHVTLTQLAAHPTNGRWEFAHAIHHHDALQLLALRGAKAAAQPGNPAGNAVIALEVERGFRWFGADGSLLRPTTVGAELAGDNVVVYQEMPAPALPGRFVVEATLLHDVFADQRNNVSIEFSRPYTLLRLTRQAKRAEFEVS